MGILEFIQVLVAIIIGLGIAEILKGVADLLRPGRSSVSLLHLGIAAWLFVQQVQVWWAGWRFSSVRAWQFHELLVYLLAVMVLYLAARLVFPEDAASRELRTYFDHVASRIWALIAAFFGLAAIINMWLIGTPFVTVGPISEIFLCVFLLIVARRPRLWLQTVALVLVTVHLLWRAISLGMSA